MSLGEQLQMLFLGKEEFTLKEAYEAIPDKPATTIRGRIYDNLGIKFEKIKKGVYKAIEGDCQCVLVEGDGNDMSFLEDNSVDLLLNDFPWDDKANKGGNRNFANQYPTFKYTLENFKEKARVLKEGSFLVEILPAENETNYEEVFRIKQLAKESGLQYYANVPWIKGSFVSNTGRKSKNSEMVMIFSKGKARSLRLDAKKTKATGVEHFMSGSKGMLPTAFNFDPVPRKSKIHQSEKPQLLIEEIIEYLSLEGELVVDQYAGSGVTGVAALSKKRNCVLIELLKDNVNKIIDRFKGIGVNVNNISVTA